MLRDLFIHLHHLPWEQPYPNVETQSDDCLNHSASTGRNFVDVFSLYLETVVLDANVFGERCPTRGQYAL